MKKRPLTICYFNNDFLNKSGISVTNNHLHKEPMHRHEYYEFELIINGEPLHSINGKESRLKCGDLLFVTPADFHGYGTDAAFETITIHFLEEHIKKSFVPILNRAEAFIVNNVSEDIRVDFYDILEIYGENTPWTEYKLKNALERIFIDVFEKYGGDYTVAAGGNDAVDAVIGYVDRNFCTDMTAQMLCKMFFVSQSHLCRAFKERTGKGFNQYLTEKRLEYSKKLLCDGESVIDACYESGFSSERNFCRRFKLYTGLTPKEFSKQQKLS